MYTDVLRSYDHRTELDAACLVGMENVPKRSVLSIGLISTHQTRDEPAPLLEDRLFLDMNMNDTGHRSSVLVIHETNNRYDYESVRSCLKANDFVTDESSDLFDAIDKFSDFTAKGPEGVVYLVKVRPGSQHDRLITQLDRNAATLDIPIAVISDLSRGEETNTQFTFGSVRRLKKAIDKFCSPSLS